MQFIEDGEVVAITPEGATFTASPTARAETAT